MLQNEINALRFEILNFLPIRNFQVSIFFLGTVQDVLEMIATGLILQNFITYFTAILIHRSSTVQFFKI